MKSLLKKVVAVLVILVCILIGVSYEGSIKYLPEDIVWKLLDWQEWYEIKFNLPDKIIKSSTPSQFEALIVENDVPARMRDGVHLRANIFRPKKVDKLPTLVIRVPYGKDGSYIYMPAVGKHFAQRGYAVVTQDVRGKWASDGVFDPMVNEINDGYDTIEWVINQPWSNGTVGIFGESYYSYTSMAAAVSKHPAIKCLSLSTMDADPYRSTYRNGAFQMQAMGQWAIYMEHQTEQNSLRMDRWHLPLSTYSDAPGIPSAFFKKIIQNPFRGLMSDSINLAPQLAEVDLPVLHFAGWYDNFLNGSILNWQSLRKTFPDRNSIIIGPWDHEYSPRDTGRIGRIPIGKAASNTYYNEIEKFFDACLKKDKPELYQPSPVRIFVMGDNVWRDEQEWPLARTKYQEYYFTSQGNANTAKGNGRLVADVPATEAKDEFIYDPTNPVQITMEENQWEVAKLMTDRNLVQAREDVLVFTSEQLENDTEVTGPIKVTLYASSSAKDTDFTATLVDVYPDGHTQLIQDGIIRARYRQSNTEQNLLEPGKIYEFVIDLWATSNVFKKGHRFQVEISSSNFDKFNRNLNTSEAFGMSSKIVSANQTIYHGGSYPSRITLPIIPR